MSLHDDTELHSVFPILSFMVPSLIASMQELVLKKWLILKAIQPSTNTASNVKMVVVDSAVITQTVFKGTVTAATGSIIKA